MVLHFRVLMLRHDVVLDNSFVYFFDRLEPAVQGEVMSVCKSLESDPYFLPDLNDCLVEVKEEPWRVACQRIRGWGVWQMAWFFEYFENEQATPEHVVVMLRHQPFEPIQPRAIY